MWYSGYGLGIGRSLVPAFRDDSDIDLALLTPLMLFWVGLRSSYDSTHLRERPQPLIRVEELLRSC